MLSAGRKIILTPINGISPFTKFFFKNKKRISKVLKTVQKPDQLAVAGHLAHPPEEHGGGVVAAVLEPTPFWVLA